MKAQTVKNAVIVPAGAKGGFVVKQPADRSGRDAAAPRSRPATGCSSARCSTSPTTSSTAHGRAARSRSCATTATIPTSSSRPTRAPRRSPTSPTRSRCERGFWLGDAFASGGSAGYDHKAMGITARGAWESVTPALPRARRRPATATTSPSSASATCRATCSATACCCREHIRLVAAFDHRHVFLDPNPDPAASFAERKRLFELPRSSWADYDPALISRGRRRVPAHGEVDPDLAPRCAPRSASPTTSTRCTPAELIRAILRAPGRPALQRRHRHLREGARPRRTPTSATRPTTRVRVDGAELRCRVVGEGGNLGFTQRGRVEYALAGGRINTDAIDNSRGRRHLRPRGQHQDPARRRGARRRARPTTSATRCSPTMTDEVAALVLRDNYAQNLVLGNCSRTQAPSMLPVHQRFMQRARAARRARPRARVPAQRRTTIEALRAAGLGLTFARARGAARLRRRCSSNEDLLDSGLPDEPWSSDDAARLLPAALTSRFGDRLDAHPLRRRSSRRRSSTTSSTGRHRRSSSARSRRPVPTRPRWCVPTRSIASVRARGHLAADRGARRRGPRPRRRRAVPGGAPAAGPGSALAALRPLRAVDVAAEIAHSRRRRCARAVGPVAAARCRGRAAAPCAGQEFVERGRAGRHRGRRAAAARRVLAARRRRDRGAARAAPPEEVGRVYFALSDLRGRHVAVPHHRASRGDRWSALPARRCATTSTRR